MARLREPESPNGTVQAAEDAEDRQRWIERLERLGVPDPEGRADAVLAQRRRTEADIAARRSA